MVDNVMLAQCDGCTLQILVYFAVRSHEAKFLSLEDGGVPLPQKLQKASGNTNPGLR
jgi:hypothetical protein